MAGARGAAARDLTAIGVDLASFFPYTPLPGTEDYEAALSDGAMLERDFNAWDCLHIVNRHPTLTPAEVYREYCDAHRAFYRWRRVAWSLATGYGVRELGAAARYGMLVQQLYFTYAYRRGWHPMMGGLWRLRDRSVQRQAVTDAEAAAAFGPARGTGGASCCHPRLIARRRNAGASARPAGLIGSCPAVLPRRFAGLLQCYGCAHPDSSSDLSNGDNASSLTT